MDHSGAAVSYFWSCLTRSSDCPLLSETKLFYFGLLVTGIYAMLLLMFILDLTFWWSIDELHSQSNEYMNLVKEKLKRVKLDQQKLMSTESRVSKQLAKTEQCQRVVSTFRSAILSNDAEHIALLTAKAGGNIETDFSKLEM